MYSYRNQPDTEQSAISNQNYYYTIIPSFALQRPTQIRGQINCYSINIPSMYQSKHAYLIFFSFQLYRKTDNYIKHNKNDLSLFSFEKVLRFILC